MLQKDPNKMRNILFEVCQQFEQDTFEEHKENDSFPPTDVEIDDDEAPFSEDSVIPTLHPKEISPPMKVCIFKKG